MVLLPQTADREAVIGALKSAGVNPSVNFRSLHHFTWFGDNAGVGPTGLAVCGALADRAFSLPLHVGLTDADADVDRVCRELLNLLPA